MLFAPDKVEGMFPAPGPHDSKYTRGVVGLITGTDEYPGAGVLSVSAASMCGVGYVRASLPYESRLAVLANHPEVVLSATSEHKPDAWAVGSGFVGLADDDARSREIRRILEITSQRQWYVVVDAGALETFATLPSDVLTDEARTRCVVTPHTGEAQRLFSVLGVEASRGQIEHNREFYALLLAQKLECTVVLKGSPTFVADWTGCAYELPPATHWLATAGTGDVLAGIMGAVVALNHERLKLGEISLADAAAAAVIVHSFAAGQAAYDMSTIREWYLGRSTSGKEHADFTTNFSLVEMIACIPGSLACLRDKTYDEEMVSI